jgi:putative Mg2+ transporter-C (MgtC) family protein
MRPRIVRSPVDICFGMHLNGNQGATQIIAYVVSGVLPGRRRHMKQGRNVWGLNTAATVWCSAAVGAWLVLTWRSKPFC